MKNLKIKICGMTDLENIAGASELGPDYMGFILYDRSPRYVSLKKAEKLVRIVPPSVQKTGVIVDEPIENAISIAGSGIFDILQVHGNESPGYCKILSGYIQLIKTFRISDRLPENMEDYRQYSFMFLFDTGGKEFGGSGKKFDHSILSKYNLNKEYILSGGISADDSFILKTSNRSKMSGVDLNSRFEVSPGIKNITLLKKFIENLRTNDDND